MTGTWTRPLPSLVARLLASILKVEYGAHRPFIIDVQSKLQPDPDDMTAAYMRILIHAVNSSLFPEADLDSAAWIGPPPKL